MTFVDETCLNILSAQSFWLSAQICDFSSRAYLWYKSMSIYSKIMFIRYRDSQIGFQFLLLASARHIRVVEIDQWQHWSDFHCHDWSILYRMHIIIITLIYMSVGGCLVTYCFWATLQDEVLLLFVINSIAQITRLIWDTMFLILYYFTCFSFVIS